MIETCEVLREAIENNDLLTAASEVAGLVAIVALIALRDYLRSRQ